MGLRFARGDEVVDVSARADASRPGGAIVTLGERTLKVTLVATPDGGLLVTTEDGRTIKAAVTRDGTRHWVSVGGRTLALDEVESVGDAGAGHGGLEAPMPGKVLEVAVAVGDEVEAGQTLMVIEAMKMEHAIKAPHAGVVSAVAAAIGDMVNPGSALVTIEA